MMFIKNNISLSITFLLFYYRHYLKSNSKYTNFRYNPSIIIVARYLDNFTTIMEDRLCPILTKPVFL